MKLLLAGMIAACYGSGVADWDERQDLLKRFGSEWSGVPSGCEELAVPAGEPYRSGAPAKLYIAMTCGPCSELRRWIEARQPLGLDLVAAESLPAGSIRRLRYEPGDGTPYVLEGVRAFGRALEHINFGCGVCRHVAEAADCVAVHSISDGLQAGLGPGS